MPLTQTFQPGNTTRTWWVRFVFEFRYLFFYFDLQILKFQSAFAPELSTTFFQVS